MHPPIPTFSNLFAKKELMCFHKDSLDIWDGRLQDVWCLIVSSAQTDEEFYIPVHTEDENEKRIFAAVAEMEWLHEADRIYEETDDDCKDIAMWEDNNGGRALIHAKEWKDWIKNN